MEPLTQRVSTSQYRYSGYGGFSMGDTNVESSETASRVCEDKAAPAPGSLETP